MVFVGQIEQKSNEQSHALDMMLNGIEPATGANASVRHAAQDVTKVTDEVMKAVDACVSKMKLSAERTNILAAWVTDIAARVVGVDVTLKGVRASNNEIASIANQVNILAINAKIEAVCAGDYGRGFAVVAEANNELSKENGWSYPQHFTKRRFPLRVDRWYSR